MLHRDELVLSTSRVDAHGDRVAPEALVDGVEQLGRYYLPVLNNHDPRLPPLGRVVGGHTRELKDGELALIGEVEVFEPGDEVPPFTEEKSIRSRVGRIETACFIEYDRSYSTPEYRSEVDVLGELVGSEPAEYVKKSFDPVSILTVGGVFLLGRFFDGFIGQVGADAYNALKENLKRVFSKRAEGGSERVFEFLAVMKAEGRTFEVSLYITNPTPEQIDDLFDRGLRLMDQTIPRLVIGNDNLQRFVFELSDEGFRMKYALRKDGIPLFPEDDVVT